MEAGSDEQGGDGQECCLSEGSAPINDIRVTKLLFDSERGKAALNARRLLDGKFGSNKVEVIRPGQFMPGPIRESGLKRPLLIKGDRYNFNPHMGVALTGTGPSATDLADRMDQEKEIETWDVSRQRPGPNWRLAQFFTYWHARQAHVAKQAGGQGKQPTVAAGAFGGDAAANAEELLDDADSGAVLVLDRGEGGPKQWHTAAVAQRGINPEQATKLFSGESISLDHANPNPSGNKGANKEDKPAAGPLSDDIHPPPTILNIDLVRMLERHLSRVGRTGAEDKGAACDKGVGEGGAKAGEQQGCERARKPAAAAAGVPDIGPTRTMHLQMTPMGGFNDFKAAPGGAATWLYLLSGRQVVVLLPPTAANRSLYMSWAQASLSQTLQSQVLDVFLGDYAEEATRVEVKQNEALLIPSGWFYASVAPQDCISICCFFWHPYALGDIARTQHLQLHLKQRDTDLSKRARQLMWCAALHYARNLREKMGLAPYRTARPGCSAHGTPSNSAGSGLAGLSGAGLQPRPSPHSRGPSMSGSAGHGMGAGSVSASGARRTLGGGNSTPPLQGYAVAAAMQQAAAAAAAADGSGLMSLVASPSMRRGQKRARAGPMDALHLPASVIPLSSSDGAAAGAAAAGAAAAAGGPMTPRAASTAAAAAALAAPSGQKKLKLTMSTGGGVTPGSYSRGGGPGQTAGTAAAAAAAAGGAHSGDAHSGGTASVGARPPQQQTSSGTPRLRLKGSNARHAQQQQQHDRQRWSYYSAAAAAADDEELGDCQTSPVRHPPADDDYLDMFDRSHSDAVAAAAGSAAAAAAAGRHSRQHYQQQQQWGGTAGHPAGYNQVDMSPIVGGVKGDLDALPPLNMGAAAVPVHGSSSDAVLGPATAITAMASAAAAAACGGNTPLVHKLKLKIGNKTPAGTAQGTAASAAAGTGQGTAAAVAAAAGTAQGGPVAAAVPAAAAVISAGAAGDSFAAAAAAGEASGANSPGVRSGDTAGAQAHTGLSRRSSPDESCCRNGSQQQGSGSNDASQPPAPQQQDPQQQQQQQQQGRSRRVSDCANSQMMPPPAGTTPKAAGAGANSKSWMRFRLKTPTPSPQLPPIKPSVAAEAALPPLQLGQGVAQGVALQQQKQEQRWLQVQQLVPPLQLDRLAAMQAASEQHTRQQQQAVRHHQQQQTDVPHIQGGAIPQKSSQQQQQEATPQPMQLGSIPQVDGAADCFAATVSMQQHCQHEAGLPQQQQQQGSLWLRWQQLQSAVALQQQRQQHYGATATGPTTAVGCSAALRWHGLIPQCDGAGEDSRAGSLQGPTLILQPSPAGNGDSQQQHQHQQAGKDVLRIQPAANSNGCGQLHPAGIIARNPAVQSNLQLQQRRAAAAAAAAAAAGMGRGSPNERLPGSAADDDVSPFERPDAAAVAGMSGSDTEMVLAPAAAAAADGAAVRVHDADTAATAAQGSLSRVGSSVPGAAAAVGSQQPGSRSNSPIKQQQEQASTPPPPSAPTPSRAAAGTGFGGRQQQLITPPPPTAAAAAGAGGGPLQLVSQASQQPMLPPLPTKVSAWELAELPVLLQYLQEQVATGDFGGLNPCDLPCGVTDPGYLLEQLEEAIIEAVAQQQDEAVAAACRASTPAPTGAAAAAGTSDACHSQQQQQHGGARGQAVHHRGLTELAGDASVWQERCGGLHPDPPRLETLPVELTSALQQGYAVQQTLGWGEEQLANQEHQQACVGETDPLITGGVTGAGSYQSAGSYHSGAGTARGARGEGRVGGGGAAAAAAGGGGRGGYHEGGGGGGGGMGAAGAGVGAAAGGGGGAGAGGGVTGVKRAATTAPTGQQQAKKVAEMRKKLLSKKPGR